MSNEIMLGRRARILLRWPFGLALVTWRYIWSTTPLHRTEENGDSSDFPPPLAADYVDERSQQTEDGAGPLWHRRFHVSLEGSSCTAPELIAAVTKNLNLAAPSEAAVFGKIRGATNELAVGDEYIVRMPGPWDGPVRVVHRTGTSFRLATLRGHMEAGQVEFRAERAGDTLHFTIETWNRAGTRLINILYAKLRLAKEIQFNMWVRYCQGTAAAAAGRIHDGVAIHTRRVDSPVPPDRLTPARSAPQGRHS